MLKACDMCDWGGWLGLLMSATAWNHGLILVLCRDHSEEQVQVMLYACSVDCRPTLIISLRALLELA